MFSDSTVTPSQAAGVLRALGERNGWEPNTARLWEAELYLSHHVLLGWEVDRLIALERKIRASGAPESDKAANYLHSLTGSNVEGIASQTLEDFDKQLVEVRTAAKRTAKAATSPFGMTAIALVAAGILAITMNGKKQ